jgi:UTP-glucose-1-phosphate uridylyltransferase
MIDNNGPYVRLGVIAAAGAASRVWSSSEVFPKELLPVGKVPAVERVIAEMVVEAEMEQITIVVRKVIDRMWCGR